MNNQITVVLRLPLDVDKVNRVLGVVADIWPDTKIDLFGKTGWLIQVGPDNPIFTPDDEAPIELD